MMTTHNMYTRGFRSEGGGNGHSEGAGGALALFSLPCILGPPTPTITSLRPVPDLPPLLLWLDPGDQSTHQLDAPGEGG